MRYLVSSWTRVGSTWVTEALKHLLSREVVFIDSERSLLDRFDNDEFAQFSEHTLMKTHAYSVLDLISCVNKFNDLKVISITRNFKDAFVSRCLYERNVRFGVNPVSQAVQTILTEYPNITDKAFINLIVEIDPEYVELCVIEWAIHNAKVIDANIVQLNYDLIVSSDTLIDRLLKHISSDKSKIDLAREKTKLQVMQKNRPKHFVRKGLIGDWINYLDEPTSDKIDSLILKHTNESKIT